MLHTFCHKICLSMIGRLFAARLVLLRGVGILSFSIAGTRHEHRHVMCHVVVVFVRALFVRLRMPMSAESVGFDFETVSYFELCA